MTEYEVLGGHEFAEFRQHDDGSIELHSNEENPETGEEVGTVGFLSEDELRQVGDTLRSVFEGDESAEVPDLDDMEMGQHPMFGSIIFVAVDEDGERQDDIGAAFGEPEDIIEAADALDA